MESIKNQSYRNIEIIIVDRFSSDKTAEIAKEYEARVYQLDCERAKAKNFGLRRARGRYVMFVDSDMELMPDVVKECVELAGMDNKTGGVIIPERSVGEGFWVRVRDFERLK
ncbi:glycosyltransferase (type 2) [Geoglobus acetivorans]|uniref:Glycosyltransferase (Type 2) n=1 Tax=Geoglobus acetivorans TaxID=565033 RepID=A0A0A7GBZ5_GEOAI|nr:glycosyltransferase (type 2) [Geoglobus acetivorans]